MTGAPDPRPELGLLSVRRFLVPRTITDEIHQFLRSAGESDCEAVAFWVGAVDQDVFYVRGAVIPRQQAIRSPDGDVAVVIPGDELFQLNVWLYRNSLQIAAQVHSHPGSAYHSETDDRYSVAARAGSLSLVIPDFARSPFALEHTSVHRLGAEGRWSHLQPEEAALLVTIIETE